MNIFLQDFSVQTKCENDMIDLTENLNTLITQTKINNGLLTIFVQGSTAALTTIEYEPGLKIDFSSTLNRLIPNNIQYEHNKMWNDGNGHSHVKASLIGPSLTIPIRNSKLTLGTWQQVVLLEMNTTPRLRKLVIQIIGEY